MNTARLSTRTALVSLTVDGVTQVYNGGVRLWSSRMDDY